MKLPAYILLFGICFLEPLPSKNRSNTHTYTNEKCHDVHYKCHTHWFMLSKVEKKLTPWPLVRKRNISTELPTLVSEIYCQLLRIEGCRRGQRGGSPTVVNLRFLDRSGYFSFKQLLIYPHNAEWTPFQTHCYSGNLVAPAIEPVTSGLAVRKSGWKGTNIQANRQKEWYEPISHLHISAFY
jgi:hypothetical protein